ncbi:MAG TPA: hypothetical protein DCE41_07835 [Cytophagales bacterium]|nr:hypothetical protein [Cytophagales bacterium]HAP64233.1 hypothetical protein [Cytophagales bacterium]
MHSSRTLLALIFLLTACLAIPSHAQNKRDLYRPVPDGFSEAQWKIFRKAWSQQNPWLKLQTQDGRTFDGQLLYDEKGVGFHFWKSTQLFDPRKWEEHYEFIPYGEVARINDLFVYSTARGAGAYIISGAVTGALLGLPFGVLPITAVLGAGIGGGSYLVQVFMETGGSPDLMFLMRQSGSSFYKDYRLSRRQVFQDGIDTTNLPYLRFVEWVEESPMMGKVFYQPKGQAYIGSGVAFMQQAPISSAPYIETVVGAETTLFSLPFHLGAEASVVAATTNPEPDEPLVQYLDAAGYISMPIIKFDRFGTSKFRVAPEAGALYRMLSYSFIGSAGEINLTNHLLGAMFGLKVDYRLGHKFAVWARGQGKVVAPVELPWPTPEFDPNILRATPINTNSFHTQLGISWQF